MFCFVFCCGFEIVLSCEGHHHIVYSVKLQLKYFEAGRELIFFLGQHEVFVELKRNNVSDSKQLNKVMQKRDSGQLKPICMEVIYL